MATVIIPMSGEGSRFKAAGINTLKPLIKVSDPSPDGVNVNRTMIEHVVRMFLTATQPIHFIFIPSIAHKSETEPALNKIIKTYNLVATIIWIAPHKLGPAWALKVADLGSVIVNKTAPLIVSYCDFAAKFELTDLFDSLKTAAATIVTYTGFHPHMLGSDRYSYCRLQDGKVAEIREKTSFTADHMTEETSAGIYGFANYEVFDRALTTFVGDPKNQIRGEYFCTGMCGELIADGVQVVRATKMFQWGTPADLAEYEDFADHFTGARPVKATDKATPNTPHLILPLAGAGSRFFVQGFTTPKPLLPICGVPMIIAAAADLPPTRPNPTFICLKDAAEKYDLASTITARHPTAQVVTIPSVTEGQACTCELGIMAAIVAGTLNPNDPILISACDNGIDYDIAEYNALIADATVDAVVFAFDGFVHPSARAKPNSYAWLVPAALSQQNDNQAIKIGGVSCKRWVDGTRLAIVGTMYFRRAADFLRGLDAIRARNWRVNGEFYVDAVIDELIKTPVSTGVRTRPFNARAFEVRRYVCWGMPAEYLTYNYWSDVFLTKNLVNI